METGERASFFSYSSITVLGTDGCSEMGFLSVLYPSTPFLKKCRFCGEIIHIKAENAALLFRDRRHILQHMDILGICD